ncbi:MAG: reverse transcriptase-like protein [Candidatus Omnitrophota bacterium]|jgi:ribonuclease HI|nr:MAG: reverse transcriptase-like protein [Candidatus Omnitrophota bacterium]
MKELTIYIDGASKGNPGPSGIGVVICEKGETIKNISSYIGKGTNNAAEYTALIFGLQQALILKAEKVKIHSDSQLLCRQLKREYKIKNQNLLGLYNQAVQLIAAFKDVEIQNIPRQENKGADKLANQAVAKANA